MFCDDYCCFDTQCGSKGIIPINNSKFHKVCYSHYTNIRSNYPTYTTITCSYCASSCKIIPSLFPAHIPFLPSCIFCKSRELHSPNSNLCRQCFKNKMCPTCHHVSYSIQTRPSCPHSFCKMCESKCDLCSSSPNENRELNSCGHPKDQILYGKCMHCTKNILCLVCGKNDFSMIMPLGSYICQECQAIKDLGVFSMCFCCNKYTYVVKRECNHFRCTDCFSNTCRSCSPILGNKQQLNFSLESCFSAHFEYIKICTCTQVFCSQCCGVCSNCKISNTEGIYANSLQLNFSCKNFGGKFEETGLSCGHLGCIKCRNEVQFRTCENGGSVKIDYELIKENYAKGEDNIEMLIDRQGIEDPYFNPRVRYQENRVFEFKSIERRPHSDFNKGELRSGLYITMQNNSRKSSFFCENLNSPDIISENSTFQVSLCLKCIQNTTHINCSTCDLQFCYKCSNSHRCNNEVKLLCSICNKKIIKNSSNCSHLYCYNCYNNQSSVCSICHSAEKECETCHLSGNKKMRFECSHIGCLNCMKNKYCFKCIFDENLTDPIEYTLRKCCKCSRETLGVFELICGHAVCKYCRKCDWKEMNYCCLECNFNETRKGNCFKCYRVTNYELIMKILYKKCCDYYICILHYRHECKECFRYR